MHNGIQIVVAPTAFVLYFFDFPLVTPFKNAITCNVISLLDHIFSDCLESVAVVDADALEKHKEVVWGECTIRAAM